MCYENFTILNYIIFIINHLCIINTIYLPPSLYKVFVRMYQI